MVSVCMFCGLVLGADPDALEGVSHGLCDRCLEREYPLDEPSEEGGKGENDEDQE
jgi:hypothetical protein